MNNCSNCEELNKRIESYKRVLESAVETIDGYEKAGDHFIKKLLKAKDNMEGGV